MTAVIEIRTYQLHDGSAERFHAAMHAASLPLLRAAGTDVLVAMPSVEDPLAYMIVRSYASRAEREASQAAFYASHAWTAGPRETILACIASYHTIVIDAEPALIAAMGRLAA